MPMLFSSNKLNHNKHLDLYRGTAPKSEINSRIRTINKTTKDGKIIC